MKKEYSIDVAGRTLTVQTGQLAQLANEQTASMECGLSTATASSEPREGIDFSRGVDYEEKMAL